MCEDTNKSCERFKPSTPLKKLEETEWLTGARCQVDTWIHQDHIHWYYEAQPQFSESIYREVCQTFDEFYSEGPPEFASFVFDDGLMQEIKDFISSI